MSLRGRLTHLPSYLVKKNVVNNFSERKRTLVDKCIIIGTKVVKKQRAIAMKKRATEISHLKTEMKTALKKKLGKCTSIEFKNSFFNSSVRARSWVACEKYTLEAVHLRRSMHCR